MWKEHFLLFHSTAPVDVVQEDERGAEGSRPEAACCWVVIVPIVRGGGTQGVPFKHLEPRARFGGGGGVGFRGGEEIERKLAERGIPALLAAGGLEHTNGVVGA